MEYKIALIPGDGIGPEIVSEAKKVLDKVCEKYHHTFTYSEVLLGGASIDVHGVPLTDEAIATAKASDAVLMGSIGGDAKTSPWYKLEPSKRPEAGLLAIRKALNLFANLRPAYLYKELEEACPIKKEVIGENGKKIEISVGDEVPDQEDPSRYILWMDQVWTVKSSKVDGLLSGENGLISKKLTPDDTDGENSILVTRMTISRESEDDLTLAYAKSQELAGYTVNSYELVSPFTYPADAEVTSDVFPVLFGVEAKTVEAVHPSEEEKEKMGLSSPWRTLQVEYTDGADQTRSFTLAASRPENGQVYVMAGDTDVIYLCSQEDLPWLEYTEETLLSRTVLAPDIKTIEELVITEGGKTHRFRFEHVGEETEQITCDGTKTDGDSFRNFYYTLAGMSADEVLFDGFPDTSSMKEFLGIRYRYQDGTEDVLVCYEEGSRQIYGELNQKERGFRLSASQVETMLETLKRLTEGEEITARY